MLKEDEVETMSFYSTKELENIKNKIETMGKQKHIEILNIIKNSPAAVKLNENKSGVFINLTYLPPAILDEIVKHIELIDEQENSIRVFETQHQEFKNRYFVEKEEKDTILSYSSLTK